MEYTILAADIECFSRATDNAQMIRMRDALKRIATEAAASADLIRFYEAKKSHIDTGDGFFFVIDTQDYERVLSFLDNCRVLAQNQDEIRVRAICHSGDCEKAERILCEDENGISCDNYVGSGINEAARYIDSDTIRELLENESTERFVYGLTADLFARMTNQSYLTQRSFAEYATVAKRFAGTLYIDESFRNRPARRVVVQDVQQSIDESFLSYLNSSVASLYLENHIGMGGEKFYIFPELSRDFTTKYGSARMRADEYFAEVSNAPRNVVVMGAEESGKTELSKELFKLLYATHKYLPVLLRLDQKYSGTVRNKIIDSVKKQYDGLPASFEDMKKFVLVDDFHLVGSKYYDRILDEFASVPNTYYVLFVDDVFNVNFVGREIGVEHQIVSIQEFSSTMRHDLIETWIERNQLTDENFATLDEYTEFLNTALLCGLVPATPINIIVILAEKIAYNPLNSSVTSRGHCYETLIYLALKRTNIAEGELDIYLNVLEFLSHELFANDVVSYSQTELAEFFRRYRNEFNLPYSDSKVIGTLSSSRIFSANSLGEYAFANEYMFYFFVAKYLANHRHEESVREQISSIYNNLDVSENGYIGVFVVHHINDPVILREIARNLTELYSSYEEATLSKNETGFLEKNVSNLAKITMEEHNNSRRNRLLMLQNRDQIDEASEQEDGESSEQVSDDDFDVTEELSTIRKALKTSEVMGHILKSRTGSFPLADQREYYKQASALHMRIASRFISDFSSHETEFIEYFADRIAEFPNTETLDREKTYELAVRFYLDVNLGVYVACILRSTITLASQPILGVITEVCEKVATPLSRILHLHASMWLTKKVPVADFQDLYKSGNGFVKQLIRRLIASYCDLHEIDRKDKQRISALFTIDLRQMLVDKR